MSTFKQSVPDSLQTNCKSCGGIVQYSPADENLKCIYCGMITELNKTAAEIKGNDFYYWKDKADDNESDEIIEAAEIKCRQCGATTTLPSNTSGADCAFCGTPLILNEAHIKKFWQPEYLLPFVVTQKKSAEYFKKWLSKKWFLPNKLKYSTVVTEAFKGVYMPFWTYDANTRTDYTGQRGENRTVTGRNSKGEIVESTVTDWYTAIGSVNVEFNDVVVPASHSLPPSIINRLTNWDMMNCVPYQKEYLAGFTTEIYQRDFRDAVNDARQKMNIVIENSVREDIGGDSQRIFTRNTQFNDLKFKLLLFPVWISAFKFNNKLYQFVINGRTGSVIGKYPKSTMKIIRFIALLIAAVAALFAILS